MRPYIKLLTAAVIVIGVLAPTGVAAKIINGHDSQTVAIPTGQTIDDDVYLTGRTVVIEGTINGDVYAAGRSVTIKGTVNGDVFAAAQDVAVSGKISGGVRAAGQSVRLSAASIGGGVSIFSQSFIIENDVAIVGGLNFASQEAIIRGAVGRSVVGAAETASFSSSVGRDVQVAAKTINLEPTAVITGGLRYYSDGQLNRQKGAQVNGRVQQIAVAPHQHTDHRRVNALLTIWLLASIYLVGAVWLWLVPRMPVGIAARITMHPWPSLGWGALVLVLGPLAALVLSLTVVGIPLAIILIGLYVLALYLSQFAVALIIGHQIAKRSNWRPNIYADSLIGLTLLVIIELIPIIGAIVKLLVVIVGLGGIALYARSLSAKPAQS